MVCDGWECDHVTMEKEEGSMVCFLGVLREETMKVYLSMGSALSLFVC